ncbi:uncharacterized protein UHOD_12128 [Ustilago sp. UG-2017b]|nr:uncharacterized protein UHOD_12128 [Ustilago sp. UG-2017b]
MAAAACKTCTKCLQSFPLDHFLGRCNRTCRNCASCRGVPTDSLTVPFSPLPSSLPLPASTLSLAEPSSLASAPTTAVTAAASAPSRPTPPLPPTVFLTDGVLIKSIPSAASTSSTRHFTKLIPDVCCFTEAWTVYTCIQACATNDPNLGAGLGAFLLHVIQTDHTHTWPLVASYVLTVMGLDAQEVGRSVNSYEGSTGIKESSRL